MKMRMSLASISAGLVRLQQLIFSDVNRCARSCRDSNEPWTMSVCDWDNRSLLTCLVFVVNSNHCERSSFNAKERIRSLSVFNEMIVRSRVDSCQIRRMYWKVCPLGSNWSVGMHERTKWSSLEEMKSSHKQSHAFYSLMKEKKMTERRVFTARDVKVIKEEMAKGMSQLMNKGRRLSYVHIWNETITETSWSDASSSKKPLQASICSSPSTAAEQKLPSISANKTLMSNFQTDRLTFTFHRRLDPSMHNERRYSSSLSPARTTLINVIQVWFTKAMIDRLKTLMFGNDDG